MEINSNYHSASDLFEVILEEISCAIESQKLPKPKKKSKSLATFLNSW